MDSDDEERLEAYIRGQNYFQGVAHYAVEHAIREFIRRAMPWMLDQLSYALQTVRKWLGW